MRTLIVLLGLALAGCGVSLDEAGPTTTTTPGRITTTTSTPPETATAADPVCEPLGRIRGANLELARRAQREPEWIRLQAVFEARGLGLLGAYDEAMAFVPGAVAADLRTMQNFDEAGLRSMRESSDVDDFLRRLEAAVPPEPANAATVRVDRYAEATCGFALQAG